MVLTCLFLSGCARKNADHPASELQSALATRLASSELCPSGDAQDVQKIIDVSSNGKVNLPPGCYLVKTSINIPICTQLVGAGVDQTILYRDPDGHYSGPILRVSGKSQAECVTQISGVALLGVRDTDDTGQDYGLVITNVKDFRVDHAYFEGFGFAALRVEGDSRGVIDHSIFIDNFKHAIDNLGYGVVVYGKGNWEDNVEPGGASATFVEDSLFIGNRHAIAANAGAHYVFRYNQVLRSVEACAVDAHGMGYGSAHGTQYVEIYHNTLRDPVYDECGVGIRGGGGVIFENTIQGYKNSVLLILEWGTPDMFKEEYPALDQIHELYIWGNQVKGGSSDPQVDQTGVGFIELGRDYFTVPLEGYQPYAYPHPLTSGGEYDTEAWPPVVSP